MCKWGTYVEMPVNVMKGTFEDPQYEMMNRYIDACLAPTIYKMNEEGIITINCCCGHRQDWRYNRDNVYDKYSCGGVLIDNNCCRKADSMGYEVKVENGMTEVIINNE